MTKKEAIEILEELPDRIVLMLMPLDKDFDYKQALDLAIKALMAYRDCKHCTHNIKIGNMRGCEIWECDFEEMKGGKK